MRDPLKDAAKQLTGPRQRDFIARVAEAYFDGSARQTETVLGWHRESVQPGLHERRTGIVCLANDRVRGRHKSELVDALWQPTFAPWLMLKPKQTPNCNRPFCLLASVSEPCEQP